MTLVIGEDHLQHRGKKPIKFTSKGEVLAMSLQLN